jgi:hypothetical protein
LSLAKFNHGGVGGLGSRLANQSFDAFASLLSARMIYVTQALLRRSIFAFARRQCGAEMDPLARRPSLILLR